jgi:hypothetical protein
MTPADIYSLLLAIVGAALFYQGERRRFLRQNQAGIEQFRSYSSKVLMKLIDYTLCATGSGLMAAAVLILLLEHASGLVVLVLIMCVAFWLDDERSHRRR